MKIQIKKLEKIITFTCVILLAVLAVVGIIGVFDEIYDWDIFPTSAGKNAFGSFCAIICVLVVIGAIIASMLNISRIADAIEDLASKKTKE